MKIMYTTGWFFVLAALFLSACSSAPIPKPYGYYRITLPEHASKVCTERYTQFNINQVAKILHNDTVNPDFFNIEYPPLHATIHCSYLPIQNNLPALVADAQEMVYSHAVKASAIPEQEFLNDAHHVYGVLYELKGNTATPVQFFLTDSIHHFFRASLYINTIPNQDSLAPVIDYLQVDVREMIESFRWNQ